MTENTTSPAVPSTPAVLTSSNIQPTAGSRESSEFEFVGNNGSGNGNTSNQAATLPTDDNSQTNSQVTLKSPTNTADVVNVASTENEDDEAALPGLFGWVKGTGGGLLSKVAEKTKTSMETVITTLDPQMKEYIRSGGDVTVVVASDKDVKIQPVREAFQKVLGRATIYGIPVKESSTIAEQPVGFAAGRQAALERIQNIRSSKSRAGAGNELIEDDAVVVAIESFLLEVGDDSWVDIGCLILSDVSRGIHLTNYSQPTPVDSKFVAMIKEATPETYPKRWSGYSETIGGMIEKESGISRREWHEVFSGVPRRETLLMAATALAHSYHKALLAKVDDV